ncbi:hypothetical protein A3D78_01835 [Candidatus Gottesmanbacteria bacterium RIFCSPHIGHO2_02_FULL_39_14]|uniref:Regulatory protein YycH domain-containing protein n=1 Tax=Candidatus Gottesmanbacteria bacterium RIFCSPHIGHO2_02_FULL_39_14 TaxID=1798383 RepID=A0A1F6A1I5_9BACT|nr:MAG: hypothetical protein A3D78_01835 [Candidatus Gottesmanbacteria bacterium RIFCSPHIGHO2_02_FULL_39_14]
MANLTEISIGVRKTVLYLGILLIFFLILKFIIGLAIQYYKTTHQPLPTIPNVLFGKLPKPIFIKGAVSSTGMTFTLQNIEGRPPETTASGKVYAMPKKSYTFESGEEAKKLAKSLGFEELPIIDTVYYYYTKQSDPNLTLFVDGTNLNFQLKYNYLSDISIFKIGRISGLDEVINNVRSYLSSRNLFDDTILNGNVTSEILIYDDRLKKLVPASSLSTTQAVRINYFRKEIDGMNVLPEEFDKSFNYVIYMPASGKPPNNISEISYIFWPIDMLNFATYPLISAEEAYQALTGGSAFVINRGDNSNEIIIRKIYPAYYDTSAPQPYLQPIFVFEGDNNFAAYYPAVRPEYLE